MCIRSISARSGAAVCCSPLMWRLRSVFGPGAAFSLGCSGAHPACPVGRGCVCSLPSSIPLCLIMGLQIPASLCLPVLHECVPFHSCQGCFLLVLSLPITRLSLGGSFDNYHSASTIFFYGTFFGPEGAPHTSL